MIDVVPNEDTVTESEAIDGSGTLDSGNEAVDTPSTSTSNGQTPNLGLPIIAGSDPVSHEALNTIFNKIDARFSTVNAYSKPNLIFNWNFKNLINTRGLTRYIETQVLVPIMDMWASHAGGCDFDVSTGTLTFHSINNRYSGIVGYIPNWKKYRGKQLTFSVLLSTETDCTIRLVYGEPNDGVTPMYNETYIPESSSGVFSVTGQVPENATMIRVQIYHRSVTGDDSDNPPTATIAAVKLEEGSVQTLARETNDGWEIIDYFNYAMQYNLCMYYTHKSRYGEFIGLPYSNTNILHNWYFVNAINQKLEEEYPVSGVSYSIDRWQFGGAGSKVVVTSDGIQFISTTAVAWFRQPIENFHIDNTVYTLSVLDTSNNLYTSEYSFSTGADTAENVNVTFDWGTLRFQKDADNTVYFVIYLNANTTKTWKAAKMEIGSIQTLAHKEGETWVLNDSFNSSLETIKCQRYRLYGNLVAFHYCISTTQNAYYCFLPWSTPMRIKPTVVGEPIIRKVSDNTMITVTDDITITAEAQYTNGQIIKIIGIAEPVYLSGFWGLDANL